MTELLQVPSGPTTAGVRETLIDAWAHCSNARCDGYGQTEVKGVRTVVEHTIGSRGGGGAGGEIFMPIVENAQEYVRFADGEDPRCPSCGLDRQVSEQQRPTYARLSGFPQDGLLTAPAFDPGVVNTKADEAAAADRAAQAVKIAEMEERLAVQAEQMGKLLAALGENQAD